MACETEDLPKAPAWRLTPRSPATSQVEPFAGTFSTLECKLFALDDDHCEQLAAAFLGDWLACRPIERELSLGTLRAANGLPPLALLVGAA